jgi:protein O-GlcNAc transferase
MFNTVSPMNKEDSTAPFNPTAAPLPPGAIDPAKLSIDASRSLVDWLLQQRISLALTTYQSNRLILLGVKPEGRLSSVVRTFDRAMGLYATSERLILTTRHQVWQLVNILNPGELHQGHDRLYVPRLCHLTGEIDAHDLVVDDTGRIVFVNTLYSCLATVSDRYNFTPLWQPPFITKLAPEDRCHLNGLALAGGKPRYVTACGQTDIVDGWRDHRHHGGCVIDIHTNQILATGLSMPHSPRVYQDKLWLHNSGTGEFGYLDLSPTADIAGNTYPSSPDNATPENPQSPLPNPKSKIQNLKSFHPLTFCPGYLRGLAFHGDYAVVGLSKPRDKSFTGLALEQRLTEQQVAPWCGLMVIDLKTGDVVHWLRIEGLITELYDIQVLPGVQHPSALSLQGEEIRRVFGVDPNPTRLNDRSKI